MKYTHVSILVLMLTSMVYAADADVSVSDSCEQENAQQSGEKPLCDSLNRFTVNCLKTTGGVTVGTFLTVVNGPVQIEPFTSGVLKSDASGIISSINGTAGQVLSVNSVTNTPAWATITSPDSSVLITISPNFINLQVAGGGGSGNVVGPSSSTQNAVVLFASTTGKLIQQSAAPVTIDATTNDMANVHNLNTTATITAATGVTATSGNIVAAEGQVNAGTTMTAGSGITATTGNIAASSGNVTASGLVSAGTTITAGTGLTVSSGGASITGASTITPTAGQVGLSITGNGAAAAQALVASSLAPALLLTGQGTITAPAMRMTGVPTGATSDNLLSIDGSGNVRALGANSLILNGGQPGPLTIGTTNSSVMTFVANDVVGMTVNGGNIGIGSEPTGLVPYTQLVIPGATPTSIATASTLPSSEPSSLYVQGRYVYVTNGTPGTLQIFDVSNPTAPLLKSSIGTIGQATAVSVQGSYAYVVNLSPNTLQIFNVSNPTAPFLVGFLGIDTIPVALYVQGRYVYVANFSSHTLQIIDVSNPESPVSVSSTVADLGTQDVYVQGNYAYVVNFSANTLQVFDVSNPALPLLKGSAGTAASPAFVYVQGRYAYVVNFNGSTLQIFDISNPASPTSVNGTNGTPTNSNPNGIYVQGRYTYVVNNTSNTLQVFDVSNPTAPTVVASAATGLNPNTIYVQGRYAYLVNNGSNTLQIFDLGGAYIQQLEAGGIEVGTLATRENVTINNDLAVAGGTTFARGFQAQGPSAITVSGSLITASSVPALILTGNSNFFASTPLQLHGIPTLGAFTALGVDGNGNVGFNTSSVRFKENIHDVGTQAEKVYALEPVIFDYKEEYGGAKNVFGLIAEDVERHLPNIVVYDNDGKPYSVAYQLLIPLLVKEVQRHKHDIALLYERLKPLEESTFATIKKWLLIKLGMLTA